MLFVLLLVLASLEGVRGADCDFRLFYPDKATGKFPNTGYCRTERPTFGDATWTVNSCGALTGCSCKVISRSSGFLCSCVNRFDDQTNGCYSGTELCPECPIAGEGRDSCGCDRDTNVCHEGTCKPCEAGVQYSVAKRTCANCLTRCPEDKMYFTRPCTATMDAFCAVCPNGFVCNNGKTATVCPTENYCDKGSATRCVPPQYCPGLGTQFPPPIGCDLGYSYSASGCTKCEAGSVLKDVVSIPHMETSCRKCAPGSFHNTVTDDCVACASGMYTSSAGRVDCEVCKEGEYADSSQTLCNKCAAGTYNSAHRATACVSCAAGAYSSAPGAIRCDNCFAGTYAVSATRCSLCPTGKITFLPAMSSVDECKSCPNGTFACTKCPQTSDSIANTKCVQRECTFDTMPTMYTPCVPCGAGSTHYCIGGLRLLRAQPVAGLTFMRRKARDGSDDNLIAACTTCSPGFFASKTCTLTNDTVCSRCAAPLWLMQRVASNCTSKRDTGIVACNTTEMAMIGGACNPCPPGSRKEGGRCAPFQPACPHNGTLAGVGSRACTVRCGAGTIAPDGVNCGRMQARRMNTNADVSFEGVFVGATGEFIGIQNFMVVARGAIWRSDGLECIADGFNRIAHGLATAAWGILLSEPDAGMVRRVGGAALPFRYDWAPGAMAAYNGDAVLITDAVHNCVWKLSSNLTVRTILQSGFVQPTRIAVIGVVYLMDALGVWKITAGAAVFKVYNSQLHRDMAVGMIGNNVTIALLYPQGRLVLVDATTTASREMTTEATSILWVDMLYLVVGNKLIVGASVAECACDDGLYCLMPQRQCVYAPVGTFANA